jgi:hypothetical protein
MVVLILTEVCNMAAVTDHARQCLYHAAMLELKATAAALLAPRLRDSCHVEGDGGVQHH